MRGKPMVLAMAQPADPHHLGHRERLRSRLLEGGADAFHDYELLEYILGMGRRDDVKALAKELIDRFGSLPGALAAEVPSLRAIKGLGETGVAHLKFVEACALRLMQRQVVGRPLLSSWQAVTDYLHAAMAHSITERFRVLFLNNKNILIRDEILGEGTVNHTPVYVREVIKRALDLGATALVLVHNHPSGDPTPSREDIDMTKTLADAGRPLSITVHDHIIIGRSGHVSFKALGVL
jgi:DNA repair protein RadC